MSKNDESNEINNQKTEFLKYCIDNLENRISMLENRANILIAVISIFFAVIGYLLKEIVTVNSIIIETTERIFLFIAFLLFFPILLLLIQTIRASKYIFLSELPLNIMNIRYNLMWFTKEIPNTINNYKKAIENLTEEDILSNYMRTHLTLLQAIKRKYQFYRPAIVLVKIFITWCGVGILLIMILSAIIGLVSGINNTYFY